MQEPRSSASQLASRCMCSHTNLTSAVQNGSSRRVPWRSRALCGLLSLCSHLLRTALRLASGAVRCARGLSRLAPPLVLRRTTPLPLLARSRLAEVLLSHPSQPLGVRLSVLAGTEQHEVSVARERRVAPKSTHDTAATRPAASEVHEPTHRPGSRIRPGNGLSRRIWGRVNQAAGDLLPASVAAGQQQDVSLRRRAGVPREQRQRAFERTCWSRVSTVSSSAWQRCVSGQNHGLGRRLSTRAFGQSAHFHGGPVASGVSLSSLSSLSERSSTRAARGNVSREQPPPRRMTHQAGRGRVRQAPLARCRTLLLQGNACK